MNARIFKRTVFGLLLAVTLFASACGTLEIEQEPATGITESGTTPTATPLPTATEIAAPTPTEMPSPTPTSEAHEEKVVRDSEIVSLDETWNQYTNYQAGFTIKFPKTMVAFFGSCTWNQEQGSYRPEMALVPVKLFEDTDAVYIAPEYYYELAGERTETTADGGTRYFYDACNQITNALELLRDPENRYAQAQMWKLVIKEVRDGAELEGFIKARYGSGCSLGEQMVSKQDGVYDVRILGDGKGLEETQCPLNFGTVVKYYPEGNTVIAWDTGQAYTFPADKTNTVTHDQEMVDSFEFITDDASVPAVDTSPAGAVEPSPSAAEGDPVAGLTSYTNDDFGFTFQYPADWTLEIVPRRALDEGPGSPQWLADVIVLNKGKMAISIQHIRMSESVAWDGRYAGGGPYQEAATGDSLTLIGQDTHKMVWTYNGGIKAIEVQAVNQDADLVLQIALYDASVEWSGDPAAETIPEAAIGVLDQILSSFTLTQ